MQLAIKEKALFSVIKARVKKDAVLMTRRMAPIFRSQHAFVNSKIKSLLNTGNIDLSEFTDSLASAMVEPIFNSAKDGYDAGIKGDSIKGYFDFDVKASGEASFGFAMGDPQIDEWLSNNTFKFSDSINKSTQTSLSNMAKSSIRKGGSPLKIQERLQDSINGKFKGLYGSKGNEFLTAWQARRISLTSTAQAQNGGHLSGMINSGVVKYKGWLSSGDKKVRDTHARAHNKYTRIGIPLNENFIVGQSTLSSPGILVKGDAGEVINCRCSIIARKQGKSRCGQNKKIIDIVLIQKGKSDCGGKVCYPNNLNFGSGGKPSSVKPIKPSSSGGSVFQPAKNIKMAESITKKQWKKIYHGEGYNNLSSTEKLNVLNNINQGVYDFESKSLNWKNLSKKERPDLYLFDFSNKLDMSGINNGKFKKYNSNFRNDSVLGFAGTDKKIKDNLVAFNINKRSEFARITYAPFSDKVESEIMDSLDFGISQHSTVSGSAPIVSVRHELSHVLHGVQQTSNIKIYQQNQLSFFRRFKETALDWEDIAVSDYNKTTKKHSEYYKYTRSSPTIRKTTNNLDAVSSYSKSALIETHAEIMSVFTSPHFEAGALDARFGIGIENELELMLNMDLL